MQVRDIMHEKPATCTPDTSLQEVARMMVEHDCGSIPVIEGGGSDKLVGMITDRDITCRTVAQGINPLEKTASDAMTKKCICVSLDDSLQDCCEVMEEHRIRRVPVVDQQGNCCGIVAQADIARHAPGEKSAEVLHEVSEPAHA
jgi:CBS domain-containing protein